MQINFDEIEDTGTFQPVPEGTYPCRVAEVDEAVTSKGFPMWKVKLEIQAGEQAGRVIFDRLVFSPPAMRRAKRALQCLGVEVVGQQDITSEMLLGRQCQVHVTVEEYVDREGETRSGNSVPFDGYLPADNATSGDDDDLPY